MDSALAAPCSKASRPDRVFEPVSLFPVPRWNADRSGAVSWVRGCDRVVMSQYSLYSGPASKMAAIRTVPRAIRSTPDAAGKRSVHVDLRAGIGFLQRRAEVLDPFAVGGEPKHLLLSGRDESCIGGL